MKSLYYILLVAIFLTGAAGCEKKGIKKVDGSGPVDSLELDLPSFDKIELYGIANFYITIGDVQSVVLKAQDNIMDILTYEVNNKKLSVGIKSEYYLGNHEEIRFEITVPSIEQIDLFGKGDFTLSGENQLNLDIYISGTGYVYAYDMGVEVCTIEIAGTGGCEVNVLDDLAVIITGVGDVYYRGTPTITDLIPGEGQVIDDN